MKFTSAFLALTLVFQNLAVRAAEQKMISLNAKNKEVQEIIQAYAKVSGEKFIIDPDVRGKITIIAPDKVDLPEAFHLISSALAIRGFAVVTRDGFKVIRNSRSAQKDSVEVSEQLGPNKPERLFSWVVRLQHVKAESFEKNLRNLISRDGDFFADFSTNQLILTDYISNLYKIKDVIAAVDKKIN